MSASRPLDEHRCQELLLALDVAGLAIAICDRLGKVDLTNRLAERILDAGDGILLRDGELECPSAPVELQRALREAAHPHDGQGVSPRVLRAPRSSQLADLELLFLGLSTGQRDAHGVYPRVLVFIHDPELSLRASGPLLKAQYGLTSQEARVACLLARGESPAGIDERLRVTRETVKSHLKLLFAKTHTGGEVQLVAKVLGGLGRLNPPHR